MSIYNPPDYTGIPGIVPPAPATPTPPTASPSPAAGRPPRQSPFPFAPVSATGLFIDLMRSWYRAAGDNLPAGLPSLMTIRRGIRRTGVLPTVVSDMREEFERTDRSDLRIDQPSRRQSDYQTRRFASHSYDWTNKTGIAIPATT